MLTIFNHSFLTFELRKPLESVCSPYGIVSKNCSEYFMHF